MQISRTFSIFIPSIIACFFILSFIYLVFATYWPGPYVDYWIDMPMIQTYFETGRLNWQELIIAHNNVHRILVPRLLFIADFSWFQGSNLLLIYVSFFCKVITLLLFWKILQEEKQLKAWVFALVVMAIFHNNGVGNVVHNSNMQWDLISVFALLSIYYQNKLHNENLLSKQVVLVISSWLFFVGAFFSHAGALSLLFVFPIISLLNKKWLLLVLNAALAVLFLALAFSILPVREPDEATYQPAVLMLLHKTWYVAIYVFKFFSIELGYFLGDFGFYFSLYISLAFLLSFIFVFKTQKTQGNLFFYFSLFLLLMALTIAASRVDFSPNTWWAVRYQTTAIMLVLCITLHLIIAIPSALPKTGRWNTFSKALPAVALTNTLAMFIFAEGFTYKDGFFGSNKVFSAQAQMLTFGVNQQNGAGLLPSLQAFDRIEMADSLFVKHSLAYYANKVDINQEEFSVYKKPYARLVTNKQLDNFSKNCRHTNTSPINFYPVNGKENEQAAYGFYSLLNTEQNSFLKAMLFRNTYYALDEQGIVQGFAYLYADPKQHYLKAQLRGYLVSPQVGYLVEIENGEPVCLYKLEKPSSKVIE